MTTQTTQALKLQLLNLRRNLKAKESEMDSYEISRSDEDYKELLDEVYGTVEIAGVELNTGYALEQLDPTAFRCGKSDWIDSLDKEDEEDYQQLVEEVEELENEIEDLESQIEELENSN